MANHDQLRDMEDGIIAQAIAIIERRTKKGGEALTSAKAAKDLAVLKFAEEESEVFAVFFLTQKHILIAAEVLFRGTIDGTSVYPREVVKSCLKHNAAAVILVHNHPSGVAEPSQPDIRQTERLQKALELIDVRVLDHIIVGGADTMSFSEHGLLY